MGKNHAAHGKPALQRFSEVTPRPSKNEAFSDQRSSTETVHEILWTPGLMVSITYKDTPEEAVSEWVTPPKGHGGGMCIVQRPSLDTERLKRFVNVLGKSYQYPPEDPDSTS